MIGLQNKDSSFFTVKLLNTEVDVRSEDVVSLTVIEEMDRMAQGSLRLFDPNHVYSRVLRNAVLIEVSWGYKARGVDLAGAPLEAMTGLLERRGLRAMVMNPSGSAGQDGVVYYNCNFLNVDIRGLQDHVVYTSGTKGGLISQVFQRLGISKSDVRFRRMNDALTEATGERQWETDFAFLARKAREWRTLFRIGSDPTGEKIGIFIDPDYLPSSALVRQIVGATLELNYKAGERSNVIEYSWQNHEGENGAGDNVQMVMINGETTFLRYTVENEKVRTWKLNTKRIEEEFDRRAAEGGMGSQARLVSEVMQAQDFYDPNVLKFFDPVDATTAPNGLGYSMNARILGNPAATPPAIPTFGEGFPDRFRPRPSSILEARRSPSTVPVNNLFYLRRAAHTVDRGGYFTDLEIVDVYTLSPVGELFG